MKMTTLCYPVRKGKYLMMHRVKKEHDENKDKWIGIGGKFEEKESPEECLLRETFEETGLILTSWRYRGIISFINDLYETEYMHLYTADAWEGIIGECDEGTLDWLDRSAVYDLEIWEGDKIFFWLLEQDAPFFSLKLEYHGDKLLGWAYNGIRCQKRSEEEDLFEAFKRQYREGLIR